MSEKTQEFIRIRREIVDEINNRIFANPSRNKLDIELGFILDMLTEIKYELNKQKEN